MAAVEANQIIDALAYKLGRAMVEQTISELAVQQLEGRIEELEGEGSEARDPERDSET
jgi:hypothetical protein